MCVILLDNNVSAVSTAHPVANYDNERDQLEIFPENDGKNLLLLRGADRQVLQPLGIIARNFIQN